MSMCHPDLTSPPRRVPAPRGCGPGGVASSRGHSASALHGVKWVDDKAPAQLLYQHRRPPAGIHTWLDRVAGDEIVSIAGLPATTPARTAFDLACRNPVGRAVAAIDALARTTRLDTAEVELLADRYKGHRNVRRARQALKLVDAGAESPRETWLRLLIVDAGYPKPADPDTGLRPIRRAGGDPRHGLGGHHPRRRVRG